MASDAMTDALRETLSVFDGSGTPLTTTEVADSLDLGRRSTYDRLERLGDQGRLETKKVGASARVWWRPPSAPGDGRSGHIPGRVVATDPLMEDVLDNAGVGVFVFDEDFEVAWVNEAVERYFGVDREDVLGRDKRALVEEHIAPAVADPASFVETVLATDEDTTDTERFECRVTGDDDRAERWLEYHSKPVESGAHAGGRVELYHDITDRTDAEEFESLVEAVEEYAIFTLDPDGRVRTWNPGAERIKGYEADEIRGEHFATFYTEADRNAGVPEENLAAAAEEGSVEDEGWRVRKDGTRFWADVTITALRDDRGELQGYAKVTRDTTERRNVRDERKLHLSMNRSVAEAASLEEGLQDALRDVCEWTDWVVGQAWAPTEDGTAERLDASYVESEEFAPFTEVSADFTFAPGEGIPGRVLRSKEPVWFPDVSEVSEDVYPRTSLAADAGLKAGLGIPVVANGETAVILEFYMTERREREERLVEVVTSVAAELGSLVSRKQAEDALERERERYRVTLSNLSDTVFITDDGGEFAYVCPNTHFIFGYTAADVREMGNVVELLGDDLFDVDELHEAGEISNIEHTVTDKDGDEHHLLVTAKSVSIEDGTILYACRDVTERKERERELREERDFTERVLEATPMSIVVFNRDGEVERMNERARDRLDFGESAEFAVGAPDIYDEDGDPVPPEERPYVQVFETGDPVFGWEGQVDLPRGRVWMSLNVVPLGDEDPPERVLVTANDITKLKEQTRRLEQQRDEFADELDDVFERIDDAFFALDGDWRFTYVNERAETVLDRAEADLIGQNVWQAFPEFVDSTFQERYEHARETGETVSFEEYYDSLGTWFEVTAYPSETGLSVYFQDVTRRKAREQKLERYERIIENLPVGVYRNKPGSKGQLVEANSTLAEIFGADSVAEFLEHDVAEFYPDPEQRREFSQRLEREGSVESVELEQETLDGERIWISVTAIRTEERGEVYFDGIVQDVTERKEREQALKQYQTITQTLSDAIVSVNENGVVQSANPAVEDVLGYEPDALVGEPLATLIPQRFVEDHQDAFRRYLTTGERTIDWNYIEFPGRHRDGHEVPLAISFSEYEHDGEHFFSSVFRDITERKERERQLEEQRERLSTLNHLNEVVQEITHSIVEADDRQDVEQAVCERLVETDTYLFAWIGEPDSNSDTVRVRTEAGAEDYQDSIDVTIGEDASGPVARALRTDEVQTVRDVRSEPDDSQWHEHARAYGYRSSAAIPVSHQDALYGVLTVYSERPGAFGEAETAILGRLGKVIGHAITALERRRALVSEDVVELELRMQDVFTELGILDAEGSATLERMTSLGDGSYIWYGTATEEGIELLERIVEEYPPWENVSVISEAENGGESRFELRVSDPPATSAIVDQGGTVKTARLDDGNFSMTVHLPPGADVREVVETVREVYPSVNMMSQRQTSRDRRSIRDLTNYLEEDLTERQRTALDLAYSAGFFEWPRETSGEDLAETMDISPPTFHYHLRAAERKFLGAVLDDTGVSAYSRS